MNSILLYFRLAGAKISSQMQFPISFIFSVIGTFFASFVDVIGLYIIFDRFKMIEGWTLPEICMLYGLLHMGFSIVEAFARGFDLFGNLIRTGQFDRILVRPRSIILQILGSEFKSTNLGRFLQGAIPFIYSILTLHIVNPSQWGLIFLASVNVYIIYFSLLLMQATFSFWTINGLEFMNAFTYGGLQMGQYPLSIYQKWFATFFVYIVPIALTVYFPTILILNKVDDSYYYISKLMTIISTPFCLVYMLSSLLFFRYGVTRYKSTGS